MENKHVTVLSTKKIYMAKNKYGLWWCLRRDDWFGPYDNFSDIYSALSNYLNPRSTTPPPTMSDETIELERSDLFQIGNDERGYYWRLFGSVWDGPYISERVCEFNASNYFKRLAAYEP